MSDILAKWDAFSEKLIAQITRLEEEKVQIKAENTRLKEENKALEEIRRIAESYVSAPPQMRGGVFRNLDNKL